MIRKKILKITLIIAAVILCFTTAPRAMAATSSTNATTAYLECSIFPEICKHTNKMTEINFMKNITDQANAILNPEHISKVIGNCLDQLKAIGFVIGLTAGWPSLDSILTAVINKVCEMVMSYWNDLLSQFLYSFSLPNISIPLFGQNISLFNGSIVSGFKMGGQQKDAYGNYIPTATVTINTPDGQTSTTYSTTGD
jgi:hypothetical protein